MNAPLPLLPPGEHLEGDLTREALEYSRHPWLILQQHVLFTAEAAGVAPVGVLTARYRPVPQMVTWALHPLGDR